MQKTINKLQALITKVNELQSEVNYMTDNKHIELNVQACENIASCTIDFDTIKQNIDLAIFYLKSQ